MRVQKVAGVLFLISSITLFGIGTHITNEVLKGKEQLSYAQKNLEKGTAIFGLNPITKKIGQGITQGANLRITHAQEEIKYYEHLVHKLQIAAICLLVVGGLTCCFAYRKQRVK